MSETITNVSLIDILMNVGYVGYGILLVLLIFSICSWAIILHKSLKLQQIQKESERFLELYHENGDLSEVYSFCITFRAAPVVRVFKAGYLELQRIRKEMMNLKTERKNNMDVIVGDWIEVFTSVLQETLLKEIAILEQFLIFLAVTSSSGPLLGLLGTVWGVMDSFWLIGTQGYSSLGAIAPGISSALVTTIAGLLTAIPAALAYNYLLNRVKMMSLEMECFASGLTNVVRKEFRKAL